VIGVAVPVQLVDVCQLDLAGNWTTSDPEHSSTVLSKEAKVLGKDTLTWRVHSLGYVVDGPTNVRHCRNVFAILISGKSGDIHVFTNLTNHSIMTRCDLYLQIIHLLIFIWEY